MEKITLQLPLRGETKTFYIYGLEHGAGPTPSLFVRKDALPAPPPKVLPVALG